MKHLYLTALISALLLCGSCINDDQGDCPNAALFFRYLGDQEQCCFGRHIGKVNLYVYDSEGSLVETHVRRQEDLKALQGIQLKLPAGEYHVVCWGNMYARSKVDREATLRQAVIAPPRYFEGQKLVTSDSLYFGYKNLVVSERDRIKDTVIFRNSHVKMNVYISGIEKELCHPEDSPADLWLEDVRAVMDFNHERLETKTQYIPELTYNAEKNEYKAVFNLPRFYDDNIIRLRLYADDDHPIPNGTGLLYDLSLREFMDRYEISVEDRAEELLAIRLHFNKTTISIAPWKEEEIKPGM